MSEAKDPLSAVGGAELIVAFVAPTGTHVGAVFEVFQEELKRVGYETEKVSLSRAIAQVMGCSIDGLPEDERLDKLMTAGSQLRKDAKRADFAALLGVTAIRDIRENKNAGKEHPADKPLDRTAYVLTSLKTEEEVEALRNIYGSAFFLVSIYSSEEERRENLARKIADTRHDSDHLKHLARAQELIARDRDEGERFGLRVRDTFPLGDVFVRYGDKSELQPQIRRFVELLFGNPFLTPTRDEFGMFLAAGTALRSADLARQVGAAITTEEGDLISVGCNDVPKNGGGLYWEGDPGEKRDFRLGYDSSATNKVSALAEFLCRMKAAGWLADSTKDANPTELAKSIVAGEAKDKFKGSQILSVIEFGRSVHAEMAAITDAGRRGVPLKGSWLYSTTFPCHLCARHIISAGISRVVYIEPYPKSKAHDLYKDSISVNPDQPTVDKVRFEPFVGISPSRFFSLFELIAERKDSLGTTVDWQNAPEKNPKIKQFVLSYIYIEQKVIAEIVSPILDTLVL